MNREKKVDDRDLEWSDTKGVKRPYAPPIVTEFGNVRELTRSIAGASGEAEKASHS